MKYKYEIRLDTLTEINEFVNTVNQYDEPVVLTDGMGFSVNAKSILGAMYTIEWKNLYVLSDIDIYNAIKNFVK